MTDVYARGRYAFGFCDRCGFRYSLGDLKYQVVNKIKTNLRVCPECMDIDHEQLRLGDHRYLDPQALEDPRPDNGQSASRELWSWDPVGHDSIFMTVEVGKVTVTTS